ncbi:hypothetical protein ACP4OV_009720 [Aristida adscensionis]
MEPALPKLLVSAMADVDQLFDHFDPEAFQVHVQSTTPLAAALALAEHMQAGLRGPDAFQVFNPELVARKVEAEEAMQVAIGRINAYLNQVAENVTTTRDNMRLAMGADHVYVGPGINHRAVDRDQVIFPTHGNMPPGGGVGPDRRMSKKAKLKSRGADAQSQVAFWEMNLHLLQAKEAAEATFYEALVTARDQFVQSALHQPTHIGCGYSDFELQM